MSSITVVLLVLTLTGFASGFAASGLPPSAAALGDGRLVTEIPADGPGTDGVDSVFPDQQNNWTGRVQAGTKYNGFVKFGDDGTGTAEGWVKFNLSTIPDGATITAVVFRYNCYQLFGANSAGPDIRVFQPMTTDPVTADAATIYAAAYTNGQVVSDSSPHTTGWIARALKAAGVGAVQSRLSADWLAFGMHETRPSPGYGGQVYGWNQVGPPDARPRLVVTYTTPIDIKGTYAGTKSYPLVEGGTDTVTAKFVNQGVSTALTTKIYALRNGAKFDSLTIGSWAPGLETTVVFRFTTPALDVSRHYYTFVGYNSLDSYHANDTVRYDDWVFPGGTYQAEGFDYNPSFPPSGWILVNNDGGSYMWSQVSGFAHSGTRSTWSTYEAPIRNDDWLVSPAVTPASGYIDSVGLFYATRLGSSTDTLLVYVMRGQSPSDTMRRMLWTPVNSTSYQEFRFSLESFVDSTVYIGFRKLGMSSNQLLLDDVWWMRRSGSDVGVTSIIAPPDSLVEGTPVAPRVRVKNYGVRDAVCSVRFLIEQSGVPVYDTTETGVVLGVGDSLLRTFTKVWTARPQATYNLTAHTILVGDQNPRNDTARGTCKVKSASPGGWFEKEPMPLAPSGRQVKDGGWVSYMFMNGRIYAGKGNKVGDFYSYAPTGNSWMQHTAIPLGPEGKLPAKGTAGLADGMGHVYLAKGNNTLAFWRYDVTGDSWHQLPDVPLGVSGKKVKGGDCMNWVELGGTQYVYLLKGQRCDFLRYDVGAEVWEPLNDAPTGSNGKWSNGSWIVYDGASTIYAQKAKANELWAYDLNTSTWGTLPRASLPLVGRTGRTKKSGDGGSGAWYYTAVYAFKGGNTQELWKYRPASDSWGELETIPSFGSTMKKKSVKAGGGLTAAEDALYALKGNKTCEFWLYRPGTFAEQDASGRDGAEGQGTGNTVLTPVISPNPLAEQFLNLQLPQTGPVAVRVCDALGRAVLTRAGKGGVAPLRIDTRGLSDGVYLVRIETRAGVWSRKLVIQR